MRFGEPLGTYVSPRGKPNQYRDGHFIIVDEHMTKSMRDAFAHIDACGSADHFAIRTCRIKVSWGEGKHCDYPW